MTQERIITRPAAKADQPSLEHLAVASGLFDAAELGTFSGMMSAYFDGETAEDFWVVGQEGERAVSAGYCAREGFADRVFNLYFLAVDPALQGCGHGSAVLEAVEDKLRSDGGQVLIIETSGLGSFERTRSFYRKHGYVEEARIREFYGPGDDKVVFWKKLP